MNKNFVSVALVLGTLVFPASAQDDSVLMEVSVWGAGNSTCGSFVLAMEKHGYNTRLHMNGETYPTESHAFFQFAAGYITAAGMYVDLSALAPPDFSGAMVWLRTYCQQNPTQQFQGAVSQLANAHSKGWRD